MDIVLLRWNCLIVWLMLCLIWMCVVVLGLVVGFECGWLDGILLKVDLIFGGFVGGFFVFFLFLLFVVRLLVEWVSVLGLLMFGGELFVVVVRLFWSVSLSCCFFVNWLKLIMCFGFLVLVMGFLLLVVRLYLLRNLISWVWNFEGDGNGMLF